MTSSTTPPNPKDAEQIRLDSFKRDINAKIVEAMKDGCSFVRVEVPESTLTKLIDFYKSEGYIAEPRRMIVVVTQRDSVSNYLSTAPEIEHTWVGIGQGHTKYMIIVPCDIAEQIASDLQDAIKDELESWYAGRHKGLVMIEASTYKIELRWELRWEL